MESKLFAISVIYRKDKGNNTINVQHVLSIIEAINCEEAIGKAIIRWSKMLPEHSMMFKPLIQECKLIEEVIE